MSADSSPTGWGPPGSGEPQLRGVDFSLQRGMRVAVLGPNGAGKSTMLKALAGTLPLWSGTRKVGDDVHVGVFTQDLAQELPQDQQALEYVFQIARGYSRDTTEERVRTVMASLGLTGTMPLRKIGSLSGGEKARVVLAAFVLRPVNCLCLDEPSNHLDMAALRALTAGLRDWGGALLAVTHNRAFCREFRPTHILRVSGGIATLKLCIDGDVDGVADFWEDAPGTHEQKEPKPKKEKPAKGSGGGGGGGGAATATVEVAAVAAAAPAAAFASFDDRKKLQKSKARIEKLMELIDTAEGKVKKSEEAVRPRHQLALLLALRRVATLLHFRRRSNMTCYV